MTTLGTLSVLVEADTSGLKSQLVSGVNYIKNITQKMSDNTIDWKKILTKDLSTATILTITATLAAVITKSLQFQASLSKSAEVAGGSFAQTSTDMKSLANNLVGNVGASFDDINKATVIVSTQLKSLGKDAIGAIVQSSLEMANATGMDFVTTTETMTSMLKGLGITTKEEAVDAMDKFYNALTKSSLSFSDFSKMIIDNASNIKSTNANFGDIVATLAELSNKTGMTADGVDSLFKSVMDFATGGNNSLTVLVGNVDGVRKKLQEGDLAGIFEKIKEKVQNLPVSYLTTMATQMGLSAQGAIQMKDTDLTGFDTNITNISTHVKTIKDGFDEARTSIDLMKDAWHKFEASLSTTSKSGFISDLTSGFTDILNLLNEIVKAGNPFIAMSNAVESFGGLIGTSIRTATDVLGITTEGKNYGLTAEQQTNKNYSDLVTSRLKGYADSSKMSTLFNDQSIQKIIQDAQSKNSLATLTEALQSGLQSGRTIQLQNNFNITSPAGGGQLTAEQVISKLNQYIYQNYNR